MGMKIKANSLNYMIVERTAKKNRKLLFYAAFLYILITKSFIFLKHFPQWKRRVSCTKSEKKIKDYKAKLLPCSG